MGRPESWCSQTGGPCDSPKLCTSDGCVRIAKAPDMPLFGFSAKGAGDARDAAIDQVETNADDAWKDKAAQAVSILASGNREFTTDEVWALLATAGIDVSTHEPRAMGAIMRACAREGLIEATDRTRCSVRVACHRRPVRVWRSLRFEPTTPAGGN